MQREVAQPSLQKERLSPWLEPTGNIKHFPIQSAHLTGPVKQIKPHMTRQSMPPDTVESPPLPTPEKPESSALPVPTIKLRIKQSTKNDFIFSSLFLINFQTFWDLALCFMFSFLLLGDDSHLLK